MRRLLGALILLSSCDDGAEPGQEDDLAAYCGTLQQDCELPIGGDCFDGCPDGPVTMEGDHCEIPKCKAPCFAENLLAQAECIDAETDKCSIGSCALRCRSKCDPVYLACHHDENLQCVADGACESAYDSCLADCDVDCPYIGLDY